MAFLLAGIALLATGLNSAATEWSFERGATRVPAIVIDRDFVPADRDENPKTVYRVRYRYSTLEGEARERVEEVPVERWEALLPGAELEVALLSGFEPRTEEKTRANRGGALALLAMGTPFTAFGVWFGIPRMKRALRLQCPSVDHVRSKPAYRSQARQSHDAFRAEARAPGFAVFGLIRSGAKCFRTTK